MALFVAACRGWSREFGQHAVRLRNGLRLQAQTPISHESDASDGKRNKLATLRHVSLLFPSDASLSWQRHKRGHVKTVVFNLHPAMRIAQSAELMLKFTPWRSAVTLPVNAGIEAKHV
jgi:hypothetical protein